MGKSCGLGLKVASSVLEGGRQTSQQTLHRYLPELDPKSLFTLSIVNFINCLIYLVCSMAQLGPTTPTLAEGT